MIKVGDKVRFLNAVGGGIVSKVINKEMVSVQDEDGFDIPVLIKECVIVESQKSKEPTIYNTAGSMTVSTPSIQNKVEEELSNVSNVQETKEGEQLTVYLAYVPQDIKSLQTSDYDCYLLNDSNYFLFISYLSKKEEGWVARYSGIIEPNTKMFMEEFSKTQLNDLERVCVQLVAFKAGKAFDQKNPVSVEHRIDPVKFFKLHSFRESEYFDEPSLLYPIVRKDIPEKLFQVSALEIERAMKEKLREERPNKQPIQKKAMKQSDLIEVDLHIEELLETTAGMDNAAILTVQMDEFNNVMQAYGKNPGQKIVFIHGKGEGVLRKSILDELKRKYKNCIWQDASFREYGFGATMVIVK